MHRLAIVAGDDWEAALLPFSLKPGPLNPYARFTDTEDQGRLEYGTASTDMLVLSDGTLLHLGGRQASRFLRKLTRAEWGMEWDDLVRRHGAVFGATDLEVIEPPPGAAIRAVPFRDIYPGFEDFMWDWHADGLSPETGRFGRWENPGGKWDWCGVGGRWAGFFAAKPGRSGSSEPGRLDRMRRGDVDFGAMEAEARAEACAIWDGLSTQIPPGIFDGFEDWETVRARHPGNRLGSAKAWAEYGKQPAAMHVRDRTTLAGERHAFPAEAARDALAMGRSAYADARARAGWVPAAVIRDGHWHERPGKDDPAWQGPVWVERARHLVLSLSDDTAVTAVDYHS